MRTIIFGYLQLSAVVLFGLFLKSINYGFLD